MSDESEFDGEHSKDTYGDRHFRTDPSGDRRVTVGPISFVVTGAEAWSDRLTRLRVEIEKYPRRLHDDDASAFAEMERSLREMHNALVAHFAPVLRWRQSLTRTIPEYEARFDVGDDHPLAAWRLVARPTEHTIEWRRNGYSASAQEGTLAANRRAAEAALRALGVAFRVKGES